VCAITAQAPETPDSYGAFPRLTDDQVELLLEHGERRRTRVGDVLFREGEDSSELFVILQGGWRSSRDTGDRTSG
jgi:thioredoxin reductase (NADPH)